MRKNNVLEHQDQEQIIDPLTDILRDGASQLISGSVEAELQEFLFQVFGSKNGERQSRQSCVPWW